jgi:DNA polymerase-3 subunit alpha
MEKLAKEKEVVGIYISGHPLDDYRFEMNHFCNIRLFQLKSLESLVGKTLTFAGIVTNVQYRTGKNGKDWAMFTLEGYDESHDFRIFNEEYLKFRHYLVNNQFIYFKIGVKDGWVNRETGKKSDPQINFQDAKLLADVLPNFAKKISIQLNIFDLKQHLIQEMDAVFKANPGNNSIVFEVLEIEKISKKPLTETVVEPIIVNSDFEIDIDNIDDQPEMENDSAPQTPEIIDEIKVITKLEMPSRRLKVAISKELLTDLERLNVKFRLN